MTFKCHKIEDSSKNTEYFPVWSIQQNIRNEKWICTAGGDGKMIFWDFMQKNRIIEFAYAGVPVTKAKISPDGNFVAYALGYDWSEGIWGLEK